MPRGHKNRVWRFQRSGEYGDIVGAMTHDRALSLFFPITPEYEAWFAGRKTFYAVAFIASAAGQPRLSLLHSATKEEWK